MLAIEMFWSPLEKAHSSSQLRYPAAGMEKDVHLVAHCIRALPLVLIRGAEPYIYSLFALFCSISKICYILAHPFY